MTPAARDGATRAFDLTVVIPVVPGESVSDLLASLPPRTAELELDVVFAHAPDADLAEAHTWSAGRAGIRFVRAASAATCELRRAGLEAATSTWVAFPQGDSRYAPDALTAVAAFVQASAVDPVLIGLNTRREHRERDEVRDTHPTRARFAEGTRLVDLRSDPDAVQLQFESAVLRREDLARRADLLLPGVVSADDALLLAAVLVDAPQPLIGLVADAVYLERLRTVPEEDFPRFRSDADNYLRRLRAVRNLVEAADEAPVWLARAAVHELVGILRHERATPRKAIALDDAQRAQAVADAVAVMRRLGAVAATEYAATVVSSELRAVLAGWAGEQAPQCVRWARSDPRSGHSLIRYYLAGDVLEEAFLGRDGAVIEVVAGKTRQVDYLGQSLVRERVVWVRSEPQSVRLGGEVFPHDQRTSLPDDASVPRRRRPLSARVRSARKTWFSRAAAIRLLSRVPFAARRFEHAWVFMDRADLAGDNAEHLYRWIRWNRPEVNAWFVLRADSPDWRRLSREGFRLVRYGSVAHQLMLNVATEYLSSHAGVDVFRPRGDRLVGWKPRWRFTFLQHGVIHNDLSIWLNNQRIDLFVTSTNDEYAGITADGTPYVYTSREAKLTGMPRHDELRRRSDAHPWEERRDILVAPTWRNSLFLPAARPGEPRVPRPDFEESEYVTSLAALLNDPRLKAAADRIGGRIVFLPHPNIGAHFPRHLVPAHVRMTSYAEDDVQALLTDTRVFVTDYSSVAFDAAYADTAVVYFQADAGSIFGADHTLHPGYFDFTRHGFGPVCGSVDETVSEIVRAMDSREATSAYRERTRSTYPFWDDGSCERIVRLLEADRH